MRGSYQTKQREQILGYLKEHSGQSVSAKELHDASLQSGVPVGLATVYRQLERLIQDGKAKKVVTAGVGIRFQAMPESGGPGAFYTICDRCGALTRMDCGLLREIASHMAAEHGFQIDVSKSVLYGRCERCKN